MNHMITTNALTKEYDHKKVVNALDLRVPEGSVYGFLGPNGAGKSTTLKMLLGLVKPPEVRFTFWEKRCRRPIGWIFCNRPAHSSKRPPTTVI